jgi:hypothetical protein
MYRSFLTRIAQLEQRTSTTPVQRIPAHDMLLEVAHLPEAEKQTCIEQAQASLQPGGMLIVVDCTQRVLACSDYGTLCDS